MKWIAAKYIFTIAFNENTNLIRQRLWKVIQNDWRFKSLYIKFDIYVRHAVKVTGTIFSLSQVFLLGCGIRLQCNLLGREQFLEVTTNFQISYNPGENKQIGNRNTKEIQLKYERNTIEIQKKYNWNTKEIQYKV